MAQHGPRLEIWRNLLRGQRSMLLRLATRLKQDHDLTTAQFEALLSLREAKGPLTAAQLSQMLLYSSGSTTNLVARLEERGLLSRERDATDARVVLISLTPDGADLIAAASRHHVEDLRSAFAPLITDDELAPLQQFARRLAQSEGVA